MPRPKEVCKFFNSPRGCSYGEHCRFSHTSEPLSSPCNSLCKNFNIVTQDGCPFGSQCRFLHLPCDSGFLCSSCTTRAFTGVCDGCVNRHPMQTRQTSKILRDLAEQSKKTEALHLALAEERDSHITANNEINAFLDSIQTSEAQTQTDDGKTNLCSICCDRPISHALVPCGHCFCLVCIEASRRCPICRKPSDSVLTVFL